MLYHLILNRYTYFHNTEFIFIQKTVHRNKKTIHFRKRKPNLKVLFLFSGFIFKFLSFLTCHAYNGWRMYLCSSIRTKTKKKIELNVKTKKDQPKTIFATTR